MSIRINIVDPNAIKIALEARKTLDGKIMILDHLHIDIVLDVHSKTITTFPKESLSDEVYETQNAYFEKLRKDGVIVSDSIEAGNVFGSLEGVYPINDKINTIEALLLLIFKYFEYGLLSTSILSGIFLIIKILRYYT